MSDINISWFHCGRCGSLFQASPGDVDDRACSKCGCNPSLGLTAPPPNPVNPVASPNPSAAAQVEIPPRREEKKRPTKKRKRSYFMVKLVLGWLVVLLAIIFGARWLVNDDSASQKASVSAAPAKAISSEEDVALIHDKLAQCNQVFSDFLAAGTLEQRNQFVLSPITTAARMARFYSLNPLPNIAPQTLSQTHRAVLHLPAGRAIETHWTTTDGHQLDTVFVEENGEWRLDWDHFARFSEYPWPLFLAGSGETQGEFRLLARERLADERKNADTISIVLYAPRFGSTTEIGSQSPEFLIKRDSKNGRLLEAAFKLEKSDQRAFGVILPSLTPEGLIRIRVKVRRTEESTGRRFELEDVLACHWYSSDAPGVEIPAQAPKK